MRASRIHLLPAALAMAVLIFQTAPAAAGEASGQFGVVISLQGPGMLAPPPGGLCISRSLSESTRALVEVTCRHAEFVRISPQPGTPFLGVHGGAYRYWTGETAQLQGLGTVTALHLFASTAQEDPVEVRSGPLELLVVF